MFKAISMFAISMMLFAGSANAETIRLITKSLKSTDSRESKIIDLDLCGYKAISIGVTGGSFWLWDLTVSYKAPQVTRDLVRVNKNLNNSSTGWIELKKADLCVRRLTLDLESSGNVSGSYVTVYGLR